MTFDEKLEELATQMKEIIFLKLSGEAEVIVTEDTRYKYLDCNNRNTSKILTDSILSSVKNVVTPLVLQQISAYEMDRTNTLYSLYTGFKKYRFYIDGIEVYTTGAMYPYRGDYGVLGIEYSKDIKELVELTAKDFPIEGKIFESWKSGEVPIGKVSHFTLTMSESWANEVHFDRIEYNTHVKEVRYYFKSEKEEECTQQ